MQLAKSNFQFFGNKKNYMKYLTKDHNNMDYYKQIQNRIYILYERVYLDFIFHVCYSLEPWQICGFPSYVSLKLLSYVMPLSKIPVSCSPSLSSLHASSSTNFTGWGTYIIATFVFSIEKFWFHDFRETGLQNQHHDEGEATDIASVFICIWYFCKGSQNQLTQMILHGEMVYTGKLSVILGY